MKATKQQLLAALGAFISQRSGIEFGNYQCGDWKQSREAFNGDYKPILKHGKQARQMLRFVEMCESITAEKLIAATSAYCGRLQFVENEKGVYVDYTTGQYFPTEYRNAACAVLASAIWHWLGESYATGYEIRKAAQRNFGRAIQKTWFN